MHDSTDFQYNLFTVNLRDSKNKRCRDRDFSRLDILRVVETETLRDQEQERIAFQVGETLRIFGGFILSGVYACMVNYIYLISNATIIL